VAGSAQHPPHCTRRWQETHPPHTHTHPTLHSLRLLGRAVRPHESCTPCSAPGPRRHTSPLCPSPPPLSKPRPSPYRIFYNILLSYPPILSSLKRRTTFSILYVHPHLELHRHGLPSLVSCIPTWIPTCIPILSPISFQNNLQNPFMYTRTWNSTVTGYVARPNGPSPLYPPLVYSVLSSVPF
jgi:hypothetical protein